MDLADGTPRMVVGRRNALYPTPSEDAVAWVEYNPDGRYTVVVQGKEGAEKRFATPDRSEIHGLAWDDATRGYYVIVTDDSGMWFGRIDGDGVHPVTEGAYITLSNLRAGGGRLYFGSIASGRDEAHCFDLKTRREYRETAAQRRESRPQAVGRREPRYGAFLGSRFAASGGGVPREAIPQGAQSGECP